MPDVLSKQPWEELTFGMDFSSALGSGRTISSVDSVTISASTPNGKTDVTSSSETVDGDSKVAFKLIGGTDGETYPVRVRIVDDAGDKLEGDGILRVKDI